jgi:hypothetical protein
MSLPATVVAPGSLSFAGTGPLTVPTGAGLSTTISGQLAYNTTTNNFVLGANGNAGIAGLLTGSFNNFDCLLVVTSGGNLVINSLGGTCPRLIANGVTAMPTIAVPANSCSAAATTATATGAFTGDSPAVSFASDPTGVTGYGGGTSGGITINSWPTANQMNFKLCNQTSSSITPGALSVNWRITR